jgi:hypothetical protein
MRDSHPTSPCLLPPPSDLDILWQQQEPQEGTTVTTDSTSASSWPPPPEATPSAAAVPEGAASPPLPCRLWGCATSLYDVDPTTGRPAGEPVADIYAGVQLPGGCRGAAGVRCRLRTAYTQQPRLWQQAAASTAEGNKLWTCRAVL